MNAVLLIIVFSGMVALGIVFYFFPILKVFENTVLDDIIQALLVAIQNATPLGNFLVACLGGLFFLLFPLELYFINLISESKAPYETYAFYLFGILASQSLNYWMGLRGSRFCQIFIPPEKFYKLKGSLNRWGVWMILFMNMLPLPSPVLSAVLGAFKYNPKRFLLFMTIGSFVLYSTILGIKMIGFTGFEGEELSWRK